MAWQDFKMRAANDKEDAPAALAPARPAPPALRVLSGSRDAGTVDPPASTAPASASIPAEDIALLFEAAVAAGMRRGLSREQAKPVSLSILRATLANDPRLAKPSPPGTCAVCGQPDANRPLLPFMTGRAGVFTWLHPGECHREHQARQARVVDECISRASVE